MVGLKRFYDMDDEPKRRGKNSLGRNKSKHKQEENNLDIEEDLSFLDDIDKEDEEIEDLTDTYDFQDEFEEYSEDFDNYQSPQPRNKNYGNQRPRTISSRDDKKRRLLFMCIGFVSIVIVVLALVLLFKDQPKSDNKDEGNTLGQVPKQEQSTDNNTNLSDATGGSATVPTQQPGVQPDLTMQDGNINPGLPDTQNGNKMNNSGALSDPKSFISDVNGNKIPKDFVVQRIADETDFVNYTKRRGMTGDGVELLWLDAQYKGIPYSVQVPFKIWRELDPQGITVVDMEVMYLESGAKVVSYMSVKPNYKEILEDKN